MQENFYQILLTNLDEGIYFVDTERRITFWNKGAEEITGFKAEEVIGSYCYDNILNHVDEDGNHLCLNGCPLSSVMETGEPNSMHVFLHHKDGHRVPVNVRAVQINNDGVVLGSVETFTDNSRVQQLNEDIEKLKTIALYDQLTELPNRRYLDTYLKSKYNEFTVLNMPFAVIYTDIDFFKKVNDTYGHSVGDLVLKMVSKTLSGCLRNSDIVARYGGEEFVIVAPIATIENAKILGEKLRRLIETSVLRTESNEIKVTMSFGVTLIQEGDTLDALLNRADNLLYQAKESGRNRVIYG